MTNVLVTRISALPGPRLLGYSSPGLGPLLGHYGSADLESASCVPPEAVSHAAVKEADPKVGAWTPITLLGMKYSARIEVHESRREQPSALTAGTKEIIAAARQSSDARQWMAARQIDHEIPNA
jgi:hypothetical protein